MQLVILIGNLGSDPEVKYLSSGTVIANVSVATSKKWTDKSSGEKKEKVEWHRLVAFGRTAEIFGEFLKKGSKIFVEGELQTRKWVDKDEITRSTTEIVVREMQMLDSVSRDQSQPDDGGQRQPVPPASTAAQNQPQSGGLGDFDDDIPF